MDGIVRSTGWEVSGSIYCWAAIVVTNGFLGPRIGTHIDLEKMTLYKMWDGLHKAQHRVHDSRRGREKLGLTFSCAH